MAGRLVAVNVAVVCTGEWVGDMGRTGIDKRPVAGRVRVRADGVVGDHVVDTPKHGGADQALYAYAREDAAWWEAELGRGIGPGNVGENLSVEGVDISGALIGERWAVGTTLLEVSRPRFPCRVFAGFWGVPDLIARFVEHGAPGAYLRVLTEGELGSGDLVEVVHRPEHGVSVATVLRAITSEPALLPRVLEVPELAARIRERAQHRLAEARPGVVDPAVVD
jgi:MOSC domain-containing protein YiiM